MSLRQGRVLLVGTACVHPGAALAAQGFEIEYSGGAGEGISKAHSWDPSVILLDVDEGLAVLHEWKVDELTRTVPIMVISSRSLEDEVVVACLDAGASDVLAQPYSVAILGARVAAQIALYRLQVELREKVMRDELTGVFSRRYLFESMRQHVNQFSRPGPPVLCCLMIDVDHFKLVNDRLGHIEGDRILRQVAKLIFAMTRKGDVVARFGGEEFVVVLPSTDPEGARLVADKLRKAVETRCGVTISIGVSWYESPASVEEKGPYSDEEMMHLLLTRADTALYQAKTAGLMALGGATLGVVGGGILGHVAGIIEQSQKEIHTRDWMGPVLQRTRLGEIPADYYEHNLGLGFPGLGIGLGSHSTQSVYRDVPLYNNDGTPQMQQVKHTFDTARYGGVSGAIWGGLIGGGVGLAAGIASSTLLKMAESQPADRHTK